MLDLAVTPMANAGAEPDPRAEVLFEDALAVMAGRRNPLIHRRRMSLASLVDEPWAIPLHDSFLGTFISQAFHSHGLECPRAAVFTRPVRMWVAMLRTVRFLTSACPDVLSMEIAAAAEMGRLPTDENSPTRQRRWLTKDGNGLKSRGFM
jgi:DNA-binding transcriptional LysR family regulator